MSFIIFLKKQIIETLCKGLKEYWERNIVLEKKCLVFITIFMIRIC